MPIHACTCRHLQASPQLFRIKQSDTSRYRTHPHSSRILGMEGPSKPKTVRSPGVQFAIKPVLTASAKKENFLFVNAAGAIVVPLYADETRFLHRDSKGAIVVPDVFDDPVEEEKSSTKKISNKKVSVGKKETDAQRFVFNKKRKQCALCGKKPRSFLTCHQCKRKVCCAQTSCSSKSTMTCSEYPECEAVAKGSS